VAIEGPPRCRLSTACTMLGMISIDLSDYDTDKSAAYLAQYEAEFGELFDQPIKLLEIGVQRGGSMLMFRDLLPVATIAGLDLNHIDVQDDSGRIHIYQGFQQDSRILDQIAAEVAPRGFDVIVDDGSHVGEYTEASFWHMFPKHLKPGGLYVLDDWSCGYWAHWADGHSYEGEAAFRGTSAAETASNPASRQPHVVEAARRRIRAVARPIAAPFNSIPAVRDQLSKGYMKLEGASLQRRFPSHDYGMVGFVKQLIDACALDVLRARPGEGSAPESVAIVDSVRVTPSQVFVRKCLDAKVVSIPQI